MDNKDIHNGLDKKEIRDFLSQWERRKAFLGSHSEIEFIEKELIKLQERLIHCKNHSAITTLIKSNGWEQFDVEDFVPYNKDTYFPFIGTKEEFEALEKKTKKESPSN